MSQPEFGPFSGDKAFTPIKAYRLSLIAHDII